MIPIKLQPKPEQFDILVRIPGRKWLQEQGIEGEMSVPKGKTLPSYWRKVLPELWNAYGGICAYYGHFFELTSGAQYTDHFVAKSRLPVNAYDWDNLRLVCIGANRQKHQHSDVLDPMELEPETFHLNLFEGRIYPNPEKSQEVQEKAATTIRRLDLDEYNFREMRARHFWDYYSGQCSKDFLIKRNPFFYTEALRQNLL